MLSARGTSGSNPGTDSGGSEGKRGRIVVCRFFLQGRCKKGGACSFAHDAGSDRDPPLCSFFAKGECRRGSKCVFSHSVDKTTFQTMDSLSGTPTQLLSRSENAAANGATGKGKEPAPSDDNVCAICYEPPATFALLLNCDHVFCYTCAQHWRNRANKEPALADSDAIKACPVCRVPSLFVVKSSILPRDTAHKDDIVQVYRDAMARKPCRYFSRGPADTTRKRCPFGDECIYGHFDSCGNRVMGVRRPQPRPSHHQEGVPAHIRDALEGLMEAMDAMGLDPRSPDDAMDLFVSMGMPPDMTQELLMSMAMDGILAPSPEMFAGSVGGRVGAGRGITRLAGRWGLGGTGSAGTAAGRVGQRARMGVIAMASSTASATAASSRGFSPMDVNMGSALPFVTGWASPSLSHIHVYGHEIEGGYDDDDDDYETDDEDEIDHVCTCGECHLDSEEEKDGDEDGAYDSEEEDEDEDVACDCPGCNLARAGFDQDDDNDSDGYETEDVESVVDDVNGGCPCGMCDSMRRMHMSRDAAERDSDFESVD